MASDNPEETTYTPNSDGTTPSAIVTLNTNYLNGSLPAPATAAFLAQYLTFVAQHSTGHTLGFDDDYGDADGSSKMNVITDDEISSSGQDLGLYYIGTSILDKCDLQLLLTQYPSSSSTSPTPTPTPAPTPAVCQPTGSAPASSRYAAYEWNETSCEWVEYDPGGDPILIDVTGEGFHLTSAEDGVTFDIHGNGNSIPIAWTSGKHHNAFLALDRNGNGIIDSGKELFGNATAQLPSKHPNGFLALAEFDKPENGGNGDGVIDARDRIYKYLLLWIDANHDGISQPEELHSLAEMGVISIDLKYVKSERVDEYGNHFTYRGKANAGGAPKGDTVDRAIYDVFFVGADQP
jgi:hypothetical protein